jgi:hypothetical protein
MSTGSGLEFNLGNNASGTTTGLFVPVKIIEKDLVSETSEAYRCFREQKFSGNLQAYMINYVISISGYYSPYA